MTAGTQWVLSALPLWGAGGWDRAPTSSLLVQGLSFELLGDRGRQLETAIGPDLHGQKVSVLSGLAGLVGVWFGMHLEIKLAGHLFKIGLGGT